MMKFPEHKCALFLEHNHHRNLYQSLEEWLNDQADFYSWESDSARERALATDEIWTCQWYPDTPIGFYALAAPTFDELIEFANRAP